MGQEANLEKLELGSNFALSSKNIGNIDVKITARQINARKQYYQSSELTFLYDFSNRFMNN